MYLETKIETKSHFSSEKEDNLKNREDEWT